MDTTRALFGAPSLCLVDEATVTSFDGLTYNTSIASCDQVLTKDCSGRYHMAVLVRHDNIGYKVPHTTYFRLTYHVRNLRHA